MGGKCISEEIKIGGGSVRDKESAIDRLDEGRRFAITQISKYIIFLIAALLALTSFGLDINILIASSAALLVGVGLGLQNIFNDFK